MLESESYKTYRACTTGENTPKLKSTKKKVDSESSPKSKPTQASKGKRIKTSAKGDKPATKKQPTTRVPDVPSYDSDDEKISWKSSDDESEDDEANISIDDEDNDNDDDDDNTDDDDDSERTQSDSDGDEIIHPKLTTFDEEETHDEKQDEEVEGSDQRKHTPSQYESTDDEADDEEDDEVTQGYNVEEEKFDDEMTNEEEEANDLYKDVNVNMEGRDIDMTDALQMNVQAGQTTEATHVIIPAVNPEVQHSQRNLYNALVEAYEADKDILETYGDIVAYKRRRDDHDEDEEPSAGSNRGSKRRRAGKEPKSTSTPTEKTSKTTSKSTEGTLAQKEDPHESFDELMDTPFDFSAFMMHMLNVDTLTPELLVGLTFKLMKGTCKSLQYPHDLRKPLPLIPNSRGHQVIPFDHFINNDLAYLCGGVSSRTYATSVTKTKVTDYGHIKWIEELVPNTMWSQITVNYNKYALWGISHWGCKHQQFYGFAINRESARDVYFRRRIIAVIKL
ncbi:hypothetical protein Tco_1505457 [Tanacetum coccineum]